MQVLLGNSPSQSAALQYCCTLFAHPSCFLNQWPLVDSLSSCTYIQLQTDSTIAHEVNKLLNQFVCGCVTVARLTLIYWRQEHGFHRILLYFRSAKTLRKNLAADVGRRTRGSGGEENVPHGSESFLSAYLFPNAPCVTLQTVTSPCPVINVN